MKLEDITSLDFFNDITGRPHKGRQDTFIAWVVSCTKKGCKEFFASNAAIERPHCPNPDHKGKRMMYRGSVYIDVADGSVYRTGHVVRVLG